MAREMDRLEAVDIRRLRNGRYGDGGGLWLHVNDDGRYWFFRWGSQGRNILSLGATHTISLAKARARRELLLEGRDPKAEAIPRRGSPPSAKRNCRPSVGPRKNPSICTSRNGATPSTPPDWRTSLKLYAEPGAGALPVDGIDTELVLKAIEPLWISKSQTAARVRQRVRSVSIFALRAAGAAATTRRAGAVILIKCCRARGRLRPSCITPRCPTAISRS